LDSKNRNAHSFQTHNLPGPSIFFLPAGKAGVSYFFSNLAYAFTHKKHPVIIRINRLTRDTVSR
jgi:hypothetical protein